MIVESIWFSTFTIEVLFYVKSNKEIDKNEFNEKIEKLWF